MVRSLKVRLMDWGADTAEPGAGVALTRRACAAAGPAAIVTAATATKGTIFE